MTRSGADARFSFPREKSGEHRLSRPGKKRSLVDLSRRKFLLRYGRGASLAFLPAGLGFPTFPPFFPQESQAPLSEFHVHPRYRSPGELDAVLGKVQAGFDEYVTEKYQDQIAAFLREWSAELRESPEKTAGIQKTMASNFLGVSLKPTKSQLVRGGSSMQVFRMKFQEETLLGPEPFLTEWRAAMSPLTKLLTVEFQVTSIRTEPPQPLSPGLPVLLRTVVRFELVGTGAGFHREQRIGHWELDWEMFSSGEVRLQKWRVLEEIRSRSSAPIFEDITPRVFGGNGSYVFQLIPGTDYWRTVIDSACGIDIYGHNGVSFADVDGDDFDDLYVCQPAGLPNRLFRNRGDGTFEDITAISGLGILENTACALFADFNNDGRQDVIVVRASGPLLFLNEGAGKFRQKPDAFQFANPPQGAFTGAAIADYDRDGWLDVYFCLYSYYQGADQYRYPSPYFDAENGPPNFMMRNNRDATFRDVTRESGLHQNNARFSFCCGWGDYNGDRWPDLYVVNDFGRKNLYRNNGDGTFTDVAPEVGVEDVGAGMSVCWLDYDNDGKTDLYVADMWTAAGNRISEQDIFQTNATEETRTLYRKHSMGNSLFRNGRPGGGFEDSSSRSGTAMGRWSWSSDAWDFDHDGFQDLYIANGMLSGPNREDLNSFFWRQVVAKSPQRDRPSHEYELGWNAINELIRADGTWSGFERNVFYWNNQDGTFSDVSGAIGLDFIEDSRSFALADFDHDGRVELILKNRNGPQMRFLKNVMADLSPAIAFRLIGKKSNRDAIGAAVTVETSLGRQTRFLQAGSGFLAQHSKELFFGLGGTKGPVAASISWPSGLVQNLHDLPMNHRIWVEEGSPPSRREPFRTMPVSARAAVSVPRETQADPVSMETWLLVPVSAPGFSLPDLAGRVETLSTRRGKPVLLYFWTALSPQCERDLTNFQRSYTRWAGEGLQLIAVNADEPSRAEAGSALAAYRHFSFPVVRSSPDLIAIYNLLFRYLFDRHRDLSLPTSFLLDDTGTIVKIYQGPIHQAHLEKDFRDIPKTAAERLPKALPFLGVSELFDFGRNYLSLGAVFLERGYLEQSEGLFKLALGDDSSSAEAYYGLGSVYLQQQKTAKARESFEHAVQLQANYPGTLPNAWNNLGILAAREGHTEEAIQNFQRTLQIDPNHLIALDNLGNAYRQVKRWEDAKSVLQRALELSPEDAEANYSLGMVFAHLNDTERAYEHLQKALVSRPAYPEALNNLGVLYLRTKRPEEAERSFKESIRVAPAFDQAYLNLARLYAVEGNSEKARAVLLELLKQVPGHPQAQRELDELPK